MNVDFYIFGNQNDKYIQYVDDSTKNIFKNVILQSEEQLSIYHEDFLVYYIYTRKIPSGHIGFAIVFNNAIYTDFADVYSLFRSLTTKCYKRNINSIIADKKLINLIEQISIYFNDDSKFIECGKATYNLTSENSGEGKIFTTSSITQNYENIINAIKQYKWTIVLTKTINNKTTQKTEENSTNNTRDNSKTDKILMTFAIILLVVIFVVFIVMSMTNHNDKTSSNITEETMVETIAEEETESESETERTDYYQNDNKFYNNSNKYYYEDDIDYSDEDYWK